MIATLGLLLLATVTPLEASEPGATTTVPRLPAPAPAPAPASTPRSTSTSTPERSAAILIAGPEADRHAMREALQGALGAEPNLSWSEQDRMPDQASQRLLPEQETTRRIWIDVGDPARVRIFLPACPPVAGATVRILDAPAPGATGWQPIARESVVQVVRSALRLPCGDAAEVHQPVVSAPAEPDSSGSTAGAEEVTRRLEIPATASGPPPPGTARGRFGAGVAWGVHTAPFQLAEPHTESHWLGLSVQLSVRWETPRLLLAVRGTWEPSERSVDAIELRSQFDSATFSGAWKLTFGHVTLGLGAEIGGMVIRQEASLILDPNRPSAPVLLMLPGQLGTTWSSGLLFGPIAEVDVVITQHWFVHLGVGRPVAFMKVNDDNGGAAWGTSSYWRLMGGFGASL